jgi:hypothetical protein
LYFSLPDMSPHSFSRRLFARHGDALLLVVGLPLGTALTWALIVHFAPALPPLIPAPLGP